MLYVICYILYIIYYLNICFGHYSTGLSPFLFRICMKQIHTRTQSGQRFGLIGLSCSLFYEGLFFQLSQI